MTISPIHYKLNDFNFNLHSPIIIIYCGLTCNICGSVSFLKNLTMLPKFFESRFACEVYNYPTFS